MPALKLGQGCPGVPEIVETDSIELVSLDHPFELSGETLGMIRPSVGVGEHVALIVVAGPGEESFLSWRAVAAVVCGVTVPAAFNFVVDWHAAVDKATTTMAAAADTAGICMAAASRSIRANVSTICLGRSVGIGANPRSDRDVDMGGVRWRRCRHHFHAATGRPTNVESEQLGGN